MEKQDMTTETSQLKRLATDASAEATPRTQHNDSVMDSTDDVVYLLSQCEALVNDRDSWKERSFEAEKIIAELKRDKQELIRAIASVLNRS